MPALFDAPLAPHHKLIGRWVAAREEAPRRLTRHDARQHVERVFGAEVEAILKPFDLAELRVVALVGEDDLSPAITIICDSVGQIELGWIEKTNILAHTLAGPVAPVGWRAAAYRELCATLGIALPIFGYDDLIEELSAYYWDGSTDDEGAREALIMWHSADPEDLAEMTLPSDMHARRPDWMTARPAPLKDMPPLLCAAIKRLRRAHAAVKAFGRAGSAWTIERDSFDEYLPGLEDRSHLPPLTLVPFDHFARELDDVGRFGMEQGFDDVAGLCPLTDVASVDAWFVSLRLGAEVLLAAQALINLDPTNQGCAR